MAEARFNRLFDAWAPEYDRAVRGEDPEYREVFEGYEDILKAVVSAVPLPAGSDVLEVGVGTGNLTRGLLSRGWYVVGVEPSGGMRAVASRRLAGEIARGRLRLTDGHFLALPEHPHGWGAIVSSFAFHHLDQAEKRTALRRMRELLSAGGWLVIADTVFAGDDDREAARRDAERRGFRRLLHDLQTEFYPTLAEMQALLTEAGFQGDIRQLNRFARLITARPNAGALDQSTG